MLWKGEELKYWCDGGRKEKVTLKSLSFTYTGKEVFLGYFEVYFWDREIVTLLLDVKLWSYAMHTTQIVSW